LCGLGILRVNEAKVAGTYSQWDRNKVFYRDFFDEEDIFLVILKDIETKLLLD